MNKFKKKSKLFRIICGLLIFLLIENSLEKVQAQGTPFLPTRNFFVDLSIPYSLPVLRGMRVYPNKPFQFDFMVGSGDRSTITQKETALLIKYFLTCLTVPQEDLWVNLSPYEHNRIIPDELALTDAGNNLLLQDKLLKELASSLTYPESSLGKKFWNQVYKRAYEKYGTTNIPVNTFNKVWIVPDKAIVYDMGNSALIGETHLKVMLEEDYLALKKHGHVDRDGIMDMHKFTSIITKELILPELEKEVNEGKHFASVRQIFHSMILAAWFKHALQRNVLSNIYFNKKKISGIDGVDRDSKEEIYKQYLQIYKVGAYNYIREDVDPVSQQVVPRKYFSGGVFFGNWSGVKTLFVPNPRALLPILKNTPFADVNEAMASVVLKPIGRLGKDFAQLVENPESNKKNVVVTLSTLKKMAIGFAIAVPLFGVAGFTAGFGTVAAQHYFGSHQTQPAVVSQQQAPGTLSSFTASPSPVASSLPTTSSSEQSGVKASTQRILQIGQEMNPEELGYIGTIRKSISPHDIDLYNEHVASTLRVDVQDMVNNFFNNPDSNKYTRQVQTAIAAFQSKENILDLNGQLTPETRQAIDQLTPQNQSDDLGSVRVAVYDPDQTKGNSLHDIVSSGHYEITPAQNIVTPSNSDESKAYHTTATVGDLTGTWTLSNALGFLRNPPAVGTSFTKGQTGPTVTNNALDSEVKYNQPKLDALNASLGIYQGLLSSGAVTQGEIDGIAQQRDAVQNDISADQVQENNNQIPAPIDLVVTDSTAYDNEPVAPGMANPPVISYRVQHKDAYTVSLRMPVSNTFLWGMKVFFNGNPHPVNYSVDPDTWVEDGNLNLADVELTITPNPSDPLPQAGDQIPVTIVFGHPTNDTDAKLYQLGRDSRATHAPVIAEHDVPVTYPLNGQISRILVHPGQKVRPGDLLTEGNTQALEQEVQGYVTSLQANADDYTTHSSQWTDEQKRAWKIKQASLLAQYEPVQEQINEANTYVPHLPGIAAGQELMVTQVAASNGVTNGNFGSTIATLYDGTFYVGDDEHPVLIDKSYHYHDNDPIVLEYQGRRLVTTVTLVKGATSFTQKNVQNKDFFKITAKDPNFSFQKGVWVTVIPLNDHDKKIAREILAALPKQAFVSAAGGSGNPPPINPVDIVSNLYLNPQVQIPANSSLSGFNPLASYLAPQGPTQSIAQIQAQAAQNGLDGIIAQLQANAHQMGEDVGLQNKTSIEAGVYNGQLTVGGQVSGQGYQFGIDDLFSPRGWANIVLGFIGNSREQKAAKYDAKVLQPTVTREMNIYAAAVVLKTKNSAGVKAGEIDFDNQEIGTWQAVLPSLEAIQQEIHQRVDSGVSPNDLKGDIDQRLTVVDPSVPNAPAGIPNLTVLTDNRNDLVNDLVQNGFLSQGAMPVADETFSSISPDQITQWRSQVDANGVLSSQAFTHAKNAILLNQAFEIALQNQWIVLRQDGNYDLQPSFRNLTEKQVFDAIDQTTQRLYKTTWGNDTKKEFFDVLAGADSTNLDLRAAFAHNDEMKARGFKIGVDDPNSFFTIGSAVSQSISTINSLPYSLWPSTDDKTASKGNDYFVAGALVLKNPGKHKQQGASATQVVTTGLGIINTSNQVLVNFDTDVSSYNDLVASIASAQATEQSDLDQINAVKDRLASASDSNGVDALLLKEADAILTYARAHVYVQSLEQQARVDAFNLDGLLGGNEASTELIHDGVAASKAMLSRFLTPLFVFVALNFTSLGQAQSFTNDSTAGFRQGGQSSSNKSSWGNDSNADISQNIHQYLSNQNSNSPILSGDSADVQDDFIMHAKGGIGALGYFYQAKSEGESNLANPYIDSILASVPIVDYKGDSAPTGISIGDFSSFDQVLDILGSFPDASIGKGHLKKSMISWPLPILRQLYNHAHGRARQELGDIIFRAVGLNNLGQSLRQGAFGSAPGSQDTGVDVTRGQEERDLADILNNEPEAAGQVQQINPDFYETILKGTAALIPGYNPLSFKLQGNDDIVLLPNYRLRIIGWQGQVAYINGLNGSPVDEVGALFSGTNNNGLLIDNLKSSSDPRSRFYLLEAYLAGQSDAFSAIRNYNFQPDVDRLRDPGSILIWRRGLIRLFKDTGNLNHFQTLVSTYTDAGLPQLLKDLHRFGVTPPADLSTRIATAEQADIVLKIYQNQIDGNPTADSLPVISPSDMDTVIGLRQASRVYQNGAPSFTTTLSIVPHDSQGSQIFFNGIAPRAMALSGGNWNLPSVPEFSTNKDNNNFINNKPANVIIGEIINSNDHGLIHQHVRFLVNQKYTDLITLVRAINAAFVHGNQFAAVQLLDALDDILTIHPEVLQTLTPDDFDDDGLQQYPISSDIANKVFLSLLLYKKGSVGTERFLQSGYWRTDDLRVLSNGLNSQNNADAQYLGGLLNGVEGAKRRKDNIGQVFSLGPFELGGPFILDADVESSVWIKREANQNGLFLSVSPRWTDGGYTPLLDSSIPKISSLTQGQNPDVSFFRVSSDSNGLDYLNDLSVADQSSVLAGDEPDLARYVGDSNIPVTNRIQALPNLENDLSGRLLTLDEYNNSQDPQLLDAIESYDWLNTLMGDLPNIDNPGSMGIVQTALLKMFERHPDNYRPIMVLARTYTDPELHTAAHDIIGAVSNTPGLLGDYQQQISGIIDAQEKVVGTTVALDTLDKKISYRDVWVAGFRVQSQQELDELSRIKNKISREIDPRQINSYIEGQAQEATDKNTKDMFGYILAIRDDIALKLKNNEQSVPKVPQSWLWFGAAGLVGFIMWGIMKLIDMYKFNQLKKDTVRYIIFIAGKVIYLEHFDGLNGINESPEPAEDMVRVREDGVTIIKMPEPVTVDKKAKKPMKDWWEIITRWNSRHDLTADELVADFHHIKELAFDALKAIPYEAKLMQSPSGSYQKTLFYYSTIANYTFYLLNKNLERVRGLTPDQKKELKDDVRDMVESITEYVTEYSKRMHYRANDNRVWNRTLPDNHPFEVRRLYLFGQSWYGIARKILAFDYLKSKSDKEGLKSEQRLMISGERLLGIYPHDLREDIKASAAEFLKMADQTAGMDGSSRTRQAEIADRVGNFWREIKYPVQMWIFIVTATSASFFVPGVARFAPEFSPLSIFFMAWSVWWYAKPNLDFLDMGWAKQINGLALDQQKKINHLIDAAQVAVVTRVSNQDRAQISPSLKSGADVISSVPKQGKGKEGGIDLNFQPQFIQRASRDNSSIQESGFADLPDGFKGFNFNFIRFTPNLTVNGAFHLMVNFN